ncbi:alanine/glycine:cation symporter family protein [Aquimarina brevivitae]|uniref:AGCS family alanine or glycine:cation symporter n=1 Tax=Aquimarina brevivitae TaxID=323412 RepID=A0A4Q7PH32_9FLAO|nr:amino acid carrier protein [Aquimarina brevivitae]RZS99846.1 AGCS family alanine or glycine:cation symporter [Aquimarina brevivitae]
MLKAFSDWIWDWPLLVLIIGGGIFFLIYSRFTPFLHFGHTINILRGKYDDDTATGTINHFQALSSAIAATVAMGNISGVAVAIATGGPGAIFWMWISAILGMATKFYTCSLAVLYRKEDETDGIASGPMYVITKGMGEKWKPLAVFFAVAGLVGTLPIFTTNQLTQTLVDVSGISSDYKIYIGILISFFAFVVIIGGIKRIGAVAEKLVPAMVVLYLITVVTILVIKIEEVPYMISLIFSDAFSGEAALGGSLGHLIKTGIKRGSFSNEAGIGTAPMIHGMTKTKEPIREGLVAMIGPLIDTLLVCTLTAFAILATGVWQFSDQNGISLTLLAFNSALPAGLGDILLMIMVLVFAFSTLFSYSHYGVMCLGYLTKPKYGKYYNYFYVLSIIVAAVVKIDVAVNLIDSAFALMAIPTVLSGLLLAPTINDMAKKYFKELKTTSNNTVNTS